MRSNETYLLWEKFYKIKELREEVTGQFPDYLIIQLTWVIQSLALSTHRTENGN